MAVEPGAPSVTDPVTPVATPPNPPAAAPKATESDDPAVLKSKLELALRDRAAQGETNAKLNDQLRELQRQFEELNRSIETGKTQQLEGQGQYQQLWEDAKETIRLRDIRIQDLEKELENERTSTAAERLRSLALATIGNRDLGVINPEQMYALLQPTISEKAGQPVVIVGGQEVPLSTHLASLRAPGSGFDHHFAASGRSGMGTVPGASPAVSGVSDNPWVTGNITQQLILTRDNPELARTLQEQAQASQG